MTPDNSRKLEKLTNQLTEAIDLNGGVECSQNPEIFYPDDWSGLGGSTLMRTLATQTAKEICMRCPVISECLQVGVYEEYGIWGGTTPDQRKKIRKQVR